MEDEKILGIIPILVLVLDDGFILYNLKGNK